MALREKEREREKKGEREWTPMDLGWKEGGGKVKSHITHNLTMTLKLTKPNPN